ncbi:MAG: hypothetical protein NTX88_05705, partial [Candidatus Atribacteria bacterium]|nr:hypothetical protein [Candidatus Atribacteria bacterium]
MTNEERVLNTIHKQSIDYLPNQIYFTSYHTKEKLRNVMHFQTLSELDRYLDNHLSMTSIMDDVFRYHQNPEALAKAEKMGFARCDRENGTVYDRWGIGYDLYSDGYCIKHFPLTDEESIRRFTPPDPLTPGNLSQALDDLQKHSGETLVACTGYIGILEKAWGLMGFEEFMLNITLNPELIAGLLDKIVEYKMEIARQVVKTGFRCGHTGD